MTYTPFYQQHEPPQPAHNQLVRGGYLDKSSRSFPGPAPETYKQCSDAREVDLD